MSREGQWSLQYTALEEAIRKKEVTLETPTRNGETDLLYG